MFDEVYATKDELAAYMGVGVEAIQFNADILLQRASEIITIAMRHNYNSENIKHKTVARLATCAQVQDWVERESSAVSDNNIQSYSLGELSVQYSSEDMKASRLCSLSIKYLNAMHLLYKG